MMKAPLPDFRVLQFRSEAYPANQTLTNWSRVLNDMLITAEVEPVSDQPFHVEADLLILPEFRVGSGFMAPCLVRRTRAIVSADNDDCYLIVNIEGQLEVSRGRDVALLEDDDSVFLSCKQEAILLRKHGGRLMCLRVGSERLGTVVPNLEQYGGEVVRRGNAALRLLTAYIRDLDENQSLVSADLRQLVTDHVYDLLGLTLNSSRNVASLRSGDAQALHRMRAIEKYIVNNLGQENLTIGAVADAHRLSTRQVQRLFEASDTTFSEYLLLRRLQNVHAALIDPRQAHRSVSDIALASGFGDISYFNRAFRRQYGASPSEIRQIAASPSDH